MNIRIRPKRCYATYRVQCLVSGRNDLSIETSNGIIRVIGQQNFDGLYIVVYFQFGPKNQMYQYICQPEGLKMLDHF